MMKPRTKAAQPDHDTIFRVVRLTEDAREAIKQHRVGTNENNQAVIDGAVAANLPRITEVLQSLGFSALTEKQKPFRLPMSGSTVADLKASSELVGIPAAHLLLLCISALAEKPKARKRRKGAKSP